MLQKGRLRSESRWSTGKLPLLACIFTKVYQNITRAKNENKGAVRQRKITEKAIQLTNNAENNIE